MRAREGARSARHPRVTTVTILRAADRRPQPWKNGGGVTREIVTYPPGSGVEDFGWRLSMADVEAPGAFSHFAGVDRYLMMLRGTMRLDIRAEPLSPQEDAVAFPGDVPVHGEPIGGPALDLNLMVRRDRFVGQLRRVEAGALVTTNGYSAIVFATDATTVSFDQQSIDLAPFDAVLVEGIATITSPSPLIVAQVTDLR
nr:HutD family protein [Sphingomonas chungangi]